MKREYKEGEVARIIHVPDDEEWKVFDIKVGDKVITHSYLDEFIRSDVVSRWSDYVNSKFLVVRCPNNLFAFMPEDWIEPIEDVAGGGCQCDIMVTGCICGAFKKEMEGKRKDP